MSSPHSPQASTVGGVEAPSVPPGTFTTPKWRVGRATVTLTFPSVRGTLFVNPNAQRVRC